MGQVYLCIKISLMIRTEEVNLVELIVDAQNRCRHHNDPHGRWGLVTIQNRRLVECWALSVNVIYNFHFIFNVNLSRLCVNRYFPRSISNILRYSFFFFRFCSIDLGTYCFWFAWITGHSTKDVRFKTKGHEFNVLCDKHAYQI